MRSLTKIIIIFLIFSIQSCKKEDSNWEVKGKIYTTDFNTIYLFSLDLNRGRTFKDSTSITKQTFSFTGKNTDNQLKAYFLSFDKHGKGGINFLIRNGEHLNIDLKEESKSVYSGTPSSGDYNKYLSIKQKEVDHLKSLMAIYSNPDMNEDKMKSEMDKFRVIVADTDNEKMKVIKAIKSPQLNSYLALEEILTSSIIDKEKFQKIANTVSPEGNKTPYGKKIKTILDFFDAYYLSMDGGLSDYFTIKKEYDSLNDENKNSEYGKEVFENLQNLEKLGFGKTPPELIAKTVKGTDFNLKNIDKTIVLIDFWASWCGPCRLENPHYIKLYEEYKNKGFTIIGYSLDTDKEKWKKAIKKDKLVWTNISNLKKRTEDSILDSYVVDAIPANVILLNGKIAARNLFGQELDDYILTNINK